MASRISSPGERASLLIGAAVLVSFWIAFGAFSIESARRHDFLNIYTGASLARDAKWSQLHDTGAQLAVERLYSPSDQPLVPFVRPHFYAFLLAPLALLPFGVAFWTWLALQSLLYGGFGYWAMRRFGHEGLFYWSLFLPGALGIAHGQDAAVVLAVILAGFLLSERDEPFAAGLAWSLALMKFHLCFGLLLALAVSRRWKHLQGFIAGGATLAAFSAILAGPDGIKNYISLLTNSNLERLSPAPARMSNIQGILANLGLDSGAAYLFTAVLLGAAALLLLVRASRQGELWLVLAAGLAGGMLLAPHVYLYDTTALLLALLIGVQPGRPAPIRYSTFALIVPIAPLATLLGPPLTVLPALLLFAFLAALALSRMEAVGPASTGSS